MSDSRDPHSLADCPHAGEFGHWFCGRCPEHQQPCIVCGCAWATDNHGARYRVDTPVQLIVEPRW